MNDRLLDLRAEQTRANTETACEIRRGAIVTRVPTGVCLHQTACWYGVSPGQARASNGDEQLARHRRALKIHAHVTAMRAGRFVVAYSPDVYVNHGHQWNATDVGLEHEGHYDANGNPIDKPANVDVGEIIEAGRAALTWLVEQCPTIRFVHAHRQAMRSPKAAKSADPGARIFLEVGVQHGVRKLGLQIEPERHEGSGLALPRSWYGPR